MVALVADDGVVAPPAPEDERAEGVELGEVAADLVAGELDGEDEWLEELVEVDVLVSGSTYC